MRRSTICALLLLGACAETEPPSLLATDDVTFASADASAEAVPSQVLSGSLGTDEFGAENIAPAAPSSTEWSSTTWSNGKRRSWGAFQTDPYDSMATFRGYGKITVNGDGTATITGRSPRLYIQRPDQKAIWGNVEVTYYAKRIADDNPPSSAGFKLGARSWHGYQPFEACNADTYYAVARYDTQRSGLAKELKHPVAYAGSENGKKLFDPFPMNQWIGVKLVVRDKPNGDPHLAMYVDRTGGVDGGDWELVEERVDDGTWLTRDPATGCAGGDGQVIRGKAPAVFARFDGVARLDIKNFSARTIEPEFPEELFADVPADSQFATAIAWAKETGITLGCNPPQNTRFCPKGVVTREQMATFLVRFLGLQPLDNDAFDDDDDSVHERNINAIADAGITLGCNPPDNTRFCPQDPVTREQMATFLQRALKLPATSKDWFDDDDGTTHEANINRIAEAGITAGCADDRFCPKDPVTREQMVTFLYRAR